MRNETNPTEMKAQILTNYEITRETEKAILVKTEMEKDYALNGFKEFWMPKSHTKIIEEGLVIADWIIRKNEDYTSNVNTHFAHLMTEANGSVKFVTI